MIKYLSFIIAASLLSCASFKKMSSVSGEYESQGKDYRYSLTVNSDSTFVLKMFDIEFSRKCEGKWGVASKSSIFLECNSEPFPAPMGTSYMQQREREVKIVSKKKIRIDNSVLKKVK